jgi:hypothetical protein
MPVTRRVSSEPTTPGLGDPCNIVPVEVPVKGERGLQPAKRFNLLVTPTGPSVA